MFKTLQILGGYFCKFWTTLSVQNREKDRGYNFILFNVIGSKP